MSDSKDDETKSLLLVSDVQHKISAHSCTLLFFNVWKAENIYKYLLYIWPETSNSCFSLIILFRIILKLVILEKLYFIWMKLKISSYTLAQLQFDVNILSALFSLQQVLKKKEKKSIWICLNVSKKKATSFT